MPQGTKGETKGGRQTWGGVKGKGMGMGEDHLQSLQKVVTKPTSRAVHYKPRDKSKCMLSQTNTIIIPNAREEEEEEEEEEETQAVRVNQR
ncbi:hypothetical protein E2C01_094352 [Portunus trituberculatus]|uniref:Uncharacterized protein n=1 Tax=Portunus trituberculatus TaxID=210409 RepID=A0A5B7JLN7_PORTR|nr:hypothetical protein [Portunus trituberculatus]